MQKVESKIQIPLLTIAQPLVIVKLQPETKE